MTVGKNQASDIKTDSKAVPGCSSSPWNRSGLKEQLKIRSPISQALVLLKIQQYFQELTHKFQVQICVLQTDFFFWHCMKNPSCIYHHETAGQSWVLHIELWFVEEGTEGRMLDWCCHLSASCLILFVQVGKHDSSWILHNLRQGWLTPLPAHTAAVAAWNKGAAGLWI